MKHLARFAVIAGLCTLMLGAPHPAAAQAYPNGVVRVVVGSAPGGLGDVVARIVAHQLQEAWGQPVVVLNQVGAGGQIAASTVAKSAPDGQDILLDTSTFVIHPTLHAATIPYNTLRDFAFVTQLVNLPMVLIAHPAAPYKTVGELIAYAKAQPGKVTCASPLLGSASHLAGEMLKIEAGIDVMMVPYNGSPAAMLDLVAGRVDTMFNAYASAKALADQGKVRILALAASTRPADIKEYPLIADTIPGFAVASFLGLMVRTGTPRPIIDKIQRDVTRGINKPEVKAQLEKLGAQVVGSTPDEFDVYVRAEVGKWAKVIKASNIKTD
ncbi:MAG: tripartite tricarboxylate transporter substrate binding protein [Burkholderiales bacterium]|nr:tripartite tricarboxylate transporter substrate binding protein [Burkholderiales bacterium]